MLRRSVLKSIRFRSGGHEHPDFPFMGYYKHKRIISSFDNNLWIYDGMNPEFLVDIQAPQYTYGHILSRNLILGFLVPFVVGYVISRIVTATIKRPFVVSHVTSEEDPVRRFLKKLKHENVIKNFKHPLGHNQTYTQEGWRTDPKNFMIERYKL